jgi:hypothetical protein
MSFTRPAWDAAALAWDKERERLVVDTYGYRTLPGATVEQQRAEANRFARLADKKPTYAACGCCGAYHADHYTGDCRNDLYRIDDPDELHGSLGWEEVEAD